MMEVNLPLGIAVDASALYTRRSGAIEDTEVGVRDYIAVPVNLKYKLSLPVVSNIITPFAFTGPEFAFNVGNKKSEAGSEYKSTTVSWNVGLGVELVKHVQVSAAYCMGINKSITNVLAKNREQKTVAGRSQPPICSDFEENASIWGEWHFVAALPLFILILKKTLQYGESGTLLPLSLFCFLGGGCVFSCYIMCGDWGKMLIFVIAK